MAKDQTVGNMPEILLPLSDVTATAGKPLRIECDVSEGQPPAKFKWYVQFFTHNFTAVILSIILTWTFGLHNNLTINSTF